MQINAMALTLNRNSIAIVATVLLSSITGLMPYQPHQQLLYFHAAEAGVGGGACIDYDRSESTITIDCNSSFLDVVQTINDPDVIVNLGNGEYILNANLEVADGITFEMTANGDGLQYLKIAGENGITVYGKILINGVAITS